MNVTYLNPHADDFCAAPISFSLVKRRALKKYRYLLDEPIKRGQKVDVFIDGTLSSIVTQSIFNRLPKFIRYFILRVELHFWLKLNNFKDKITIHYSPDSITDKSVLYMFAYKNCTGYFDRRIQGIECFRLKIINLSHYMIRTREKGQNCAKLSNVTFTSEADVSSHRFFVRFFGSRRNVITLPFMVEDRFKLDKELSTREKKCAATGSFHALEYERPREFYKDFRSYFGLDYYHPLRKAIYDNRSSLGEFFISKISPYREAGRFSRLLSFLQKFDLSQKKYFSFNIVDFYNSCVFAIIGEEAHGLPAVGAFEAMACGCVLVGEEPYYTSIGMVAGEHYLAHGGELSDVLDVIKNKRDKTDELHRISMAAVKYVENHCQATGLYDRFVSEVSSRLQK